MWVADPGHGFKWGLSRAGCQWIAGLRPNHCYHLQDRRSCVSSNPLCVLFSFQSRFSLKHTNFKYLVPCSVLLHLLSAPVGKLHRKCCLRHGCGLFPNFADVWQSSSKLTIETITSAPAPSSRLIYAYVNVSVYFFSGFLIASFVEKYNLHRSFKWVRYNKQQ